MWNLEVSQRHSLGEISAFPFLNNFCIRLMSWEPGDGIQENADDNFVNQVTESCGRKKGPKNASDQALVPGEKRTGFQVLEQSAFRYVVRNNTTEN